MTAGKGGPTSDPDELFRDGLQLRGETAAQTMAQRMGTGIRLRVRAWSTQQLLAEERGIVPLVAVNWRRVLQCRFRHSRFMLP